MTKYLSTAVVLGLIAWQGVAPVHAEDAATLATVCMDCHVVSDFAGMDAATLKSATDEANTNDEDMADATSGISPADMTAIIDYLAAEANR